MTEAPTDIREEEPVNPEPSAKPHPLEAVVYEIFAEFETPGITSPEPDPDRQRPCRRIGAPGAWQQGLHGRGRRRAGLHDRSGQIDTRRFNRPEQTYQGWWYHWYLPKKRSHP